MFFLDAGSSKPLVQQIVEHFQTLITEGKFHSGMKIPSIRSFAESHGVSVSTVVDAYDRLVAEGLLIPRQNAGFYVRSFQHGQYLAPEAGNLANVRFDSLWMLRRIWENRSVEINPGCGWMPESWMDDDSLRRNMRNVSNHSSGSMTGYGTPKGYLPLRWKISDWLNEDEIFCPPEQLLMTNGAAHALGLLTQYLLARGDTVLVDEPGYSLLLFHLKRLGVNIVGVPWTAQGPDPVAMEQLLKQYKVKVFFTNPRLHNPTGASYTTATAHKTLQLADRHDFLIVEDDVCSDLDASTRRSLASMDQLERVIYVSSFSKTISPSLRVGYIAAHPDLVEDLTQFKIMTGLTSSEVEERIAYQILTDGRHRKYLKGLRDKLVQAQDDTRRRLQQAGMLLFNQAHEGMFVWARHPRHADAHELSNQALNHDICLAPGHLFVHDKQVSPWLRFNVGYCASDKLYEFLAAA
ncbi:PLP-dependent aminotransferase family protein [Cupriavidus basilensis]|uniref:PLP-dependent aminotransferase family protein n=1 Tax=Cupriavidus basilensis TaxID=68895 RepID=A0ABT6AMG6_9BURK|nr:PLP-dependent aminotransferase family protein [Cupriavidus basilensis]MDF3833809.1 PLP-dependent aminotransferase family protein [Cupriavidus basilensis]